uniref:Uncharacterized protein n=1 Tax=Callorhinchus milii TaxID=7868 RepID=A0A4W3JZL9_CALMI
MESLMENPMRAVLYLKELTTIVQNQQTLIQTQRHRIHELERKVEELLEENQSLKDQPFMALLPPTSPTYYPPTYLPVPSVPLAPVCSTSPALTALPSVAGPSASQPLGSGTPPPVPLPCFLPFLLQGRSQDLSLQPYLQFPSRLSTPFSLPPFPPLTLTISLLLGSRPNCPAPWDVLPKNENVLHQFCCPAADAEQKLPSSNHSSRYVERFHSHRYYSSSQEIKGGKKT